MIKLRAIDRYIVYNSQTEPPSSLSGNSYKNLTLITHTDTWLETPYWAHTWSWEGPMHWDSCPCTGRRPWYSSCTWHWGTSATTPSCWEGILSSTLPTSYTLSYSSSAILLLLFLSVHITLQWAPKVYPFFPKLGRCLKIVFKKVKELGKKRFVSG